ncbi:MAG TPA: hypothetical protein VKD72_02025 [Gemmataceae bacterium]|nr:hypothetical protein [Gemmataceae bacterium]
MIEGHIRLTLLAVEATEVLLGITATEPNDVGGPEARQRRTGLTVMPMRLPSEN